MSQNDAAGLSSIRRIAVDSLFRQFTYDLQTDSSGEDLSQLLIIYGDNGSGKTTLLKLVFHMLSSQQGGGHKTFLANTVFRRLVVEFQNGTIITAEREADKLHGSYRMRVESADQTRAEVFFPTDENDDVQLPPDGEDYSDYLNVLRALAALGFSMYFLQDDRKVWSDLFQEEEDIEQRIVHEALTERQARVWRRKLQGPEFQLERAVKRFRESVRHRFLQASNIGQANASTIYSEIAKRISNTPFATGRVDTSMISNLADTLREQASRSDAFAVFGLSPRLAISELLETLSSAQETTRSVLVTVLAPYVEGVKARLDAVQPTYDSVNALIEGLNRFYTHKRVEFDVDKGIRVFTARNEELTYGSLSSGERQLLLLFCNTLSARGRPTIFLIDEPEISLNIKWQRQLVRSLLRCIEGSQIQFILATHSLEILALHRPHVLRLANATISENPHA